MTDLDFNLPFLGFIVSQGIMFGACEIGSPAAGGPCSEKDKLGCDAAEVLKCDNSTGELTWVTIDTCPSGSSCKSDGSASTCVEKTPLQAICMNLEWCPTCVDPPWSSFDPYDAADRSTDFEIQLNGNTVKLRSNECTPCMEVGNAMIDFKGGPQNDYLQSAQLNDSSVSAILELNALFISDGNHHTQVIPVHGRAGEGCEALREKWFHRFD